MDAQYGGGWLTAADWAMATSFVKEEYDFEISGQFLEYVGGSKELATESYETVNCKKNFVKSRNILGNRKKT